MHISSYTGLSSSYSRTNFFDPLTAKYDLFAEPSAERAKEIAFFGSFDMDAEGGHAWQVVMKWALQVVQRQAKAGALSPPVHAQLNSTVIGIGDSIGNLFAFSHQVMPFVYTQLVALSCTIFLVVNACLKGTLYHPEATITSGILMPALYVMLTTLTVFGLLEVGDTIMDPFGGDPEDIAVLHFVSHTCSAALEAINDQTDAYEPSAPRRFDFAVTSSPASASAQESPSSGSVASLSPSVAAQANLDAKVSQMLQLMDACLSAQPTKRPKRTAYDGAKAHPGRAHEGRALSTAPSRSASRAQSRPSPSVDKLGMAESSRRKLASTPTPELSVSSSGSDKDDRELTRIQDERRARSPSKQVRSNTDSPFGA